MSTVTLNSIAPDFTLEDFQGSRVHLSQFRGKKHVLLVFNRGFTWPFCRAHMAQLRQDMDSFAERDVVVLVVGPENAEKFAAYFAKHRLPFIGLPDPAHYVLKLYGQEINLFKFGRMPAQVLVDKEGIARFVHYGAFMHDIPSNDELMELVDELSAVENGLEEAGQPR